MGEASERDQADVLGEKISQPANLKTAWVVLERKNKRAVNVLKVFLNFPFPLSFYKPLAYIFFLIEVKPHAVKGA